jgi:putative ABC transport system ATP-binding protein
MIIATTNLGKTFAGAAGELPALAGVDLAVPAGELLAIQGKSGSGKSTLLHLLGGLDRPTHGELRVAGEDLAALSEKQLAAWRGRQIGFVFQFFQLMPTLTALENVMLPMDFRRVLPGRERRPRALALLERMGVADQAAKLPGALSGGQQQRVAIARALANDPPLLLADEPTGNLDSVTAAAMIGLFRGLAAEGKTILLATHDRDLAGAASRRIELADGRLLGSAG